MKPRLTLSTLVRSRRTRQAFPLVRRMLRTRTIPPDIFSEAVDAILTLTTRLSPWVDLVETAYERIPKRHRHKARFDLMTFRSAIGDHQGVLRLKSRYYRGEFALIELAIVLEAAFALNDKPAAMELMKRLPQAIREAEHPDMKECLRYYQAVLRNHCEIQRGQRLLDIKHLGTLPCDLLH